MIQNLDKLIEKRKSWVQINKENNFHDSIKNLLTELYPDNAHFIYELLQNAEDAQATNVSFYLHKDKLVFEHDGKRLFDLNDIESITSIGSSTKIEKYNNIGKFGVGFKAVFSYTDTPRIYSGKYSFQINEMVVPEIIKSKDDNIDFNKTTFVFPFNNLKKPQSKAYQEIDNGLKKLDGNCLLFLNNISSISFITSYNVVGKIKRRYLSDEKIEIETNMPDIKNLKTYWLRYQDDVLVHDEDNKDKKCKIAIAYKLEKLKRINNKQEWKIVDLIKGKVFIYFPAAKEHSGLKFHIHAPFASTVARDSIKSCDSNNLLRDAISNLIIKSCFDMRDKGLLDVNSVSIFPNKSDELQNFYIPIQKSIIEAFQTENLTPTKNENYAPARKLYTGPQRITKIIDDELLSFITEEETPLWSAHPSSSQRSKDFFSSLEIKEWGYEQLLEIFENFIKYNKKEKFENYITNKDEKWLLSFYMILNKSIDEINSQDILYYMRKYCESQKYIDNIKKYKIVKIKNFNICQFIVPEEAYLENDYSKNLNTKNIKFVIVDTYIDKNNPGNENAKQFLKRIGVKEYTEAESLNTLISKSNNINEHINLIKKLIKYLHENKNDCDLIKDQKFLVLDPLNEENLKFAYISDIYLDLPYINTGLTEIRKFHHKNLLSPIYKNMLSAEELKIFVEFLKNKGIFYKLVIKRTTTAFRDSNHPMWSWNKGSVTYYQVDEDYTIENLNDYILLKSRSISNLIWNALIEADYHVGIAKYRPNYRFNIECNNSILIYTLKENAWIPNKNDKFVTPQEMSIEDLPSEFKYDDNNGLLEKIGFGENKKKKIEREKELSKLNDEIYKIKEEYAKDKGFDSVEKFENVINLVHKFTTSGGDIISLLTNSLKQKNYEFPNDDIININRREDKIKESYNNAQEKTYENRERKVRTSNNKIKNEAIIQLKNEYTNDYGIMICQICKNEMPFKKRNGEYYFETVEIFKKEVFKKEHPSQYIALCPVCAAKYKEFVKNDEDAIELLKMDILTTDSQEVQIYLGEEETTLRFVEKHLFDLQKILEFSNDNKESGD